MHRYISLLNVLYEINVYDDYTHQTVASRGIYLTAQNYFNNSLK